MHAHACIDAPFMTVRGHDTAWTCCPAPSIALALLSPCYNTFNLFTWKGIYMIDWVGWVVARTKNSRPRLSSARAVQEMGRAAGALGKLEAGQFHHDS